jgi:type VI protein secretion system component VasK
MHWPADVDGALLELQGRDGRRQQLPGHGPWALFRLLEKDIVTAPPADRDPLIFRFDLRASRLGTLDLALTPTRTAGTTLLFGEQGPGAAPTLLAPLRAHDLRTPPDALFHGLPGCPDLSE